MSLKVPTPKFEFLFGIRALYFENIRNGTQFKHFFKEMQTYQPNISEGRHIQAFILGIRVPFPHFRRTYTSGISCRFGIRGI